MPGKEVAILQHDRNEPAGIFEEYLRERGMDLCSVPVFETNEVPLISASHLLVMGGPMSVNDEKVFPWVKQEKELIRERVAMGQPVLGICLGAQLIAAAFGATVFPCTPELGWSYVQVGEDQIVSDLPGRFRVFQMHAETFAIPEGGVQVFQGGQVENQGVALGSALGLQFHVEITMEMIQEWISFLPGTDQAALHAASRRYLPESHRICHLIADHFLTAPPDHWSWLAKE